MIITKAYAKKLIKKGKAEISSPLKPCSCGKVYIAITRFDKQRTDHYLE